MEEKELVIREEIKSDIYLLRLTGDITKKSGDTLLQWRNWEAGLPDRISAMLIDFSKVSYINSAGIAALIRLCRLGIGGGYRSGCFDLHYHYEKLFNMVGLQKYLRIFPSEWSAMEQIGSNEL